MYFPSRFVCLFIYSFFLRLFIFSRIRQVFLKVGFILIWNVSPVMGSGVHIIKRILAWGLSLGVMFPFFSPLFILDLELFQGSRVKCRQRWLHGYATWEVRLRRTSLLIWCPIAPILKLLIIWFLHLCFVMRSHGSMECACGQRRYTQYSRLLLVLHIHSSIDDPYTQNSVFPPYVGLQQESKVVQGEHFLFMSE